MRQWVMQAIPLTESMVGYDVFLKIGQDFFSGQDLDIDGIASSLPYPRPAVRRQLSRMKDRGLIELQSGTGLLVPTQTFLDMLHAYRRKFESLFILRKNVREGKLLNQTGDAELARLADVLYDRFYELGWIHAHYLGSACFTMAATLARVLQAHGHQARVAWGYVEIENAGRKFVLGGRGYATPGQVEGHAMCVVDERCIFDFGIGNIRKYFRHDFPWALTTDLQREGTVLAAMETPSGDKVMWKDDWQTPDGQDELMKSLPMAEQLLGRYAEFIR